MEGWISIHRKIIDSDIYQMPPLYLRVFERLLIEANHQDNEIPYKKKGERITGKKLIRRGERLTSVRDICRWVSWFERGREVIPNPKTVQEILDWLVENDMIEIYGCKGNRTETHYKIVNYSKYQDCNNDKVTEKKQLGNSQVTEKQQSLDTNNNVNNENNDNNKHCRVGVKKYKAVVDYLNSKCGTNYRYTTAKTQKLIDARINEGFHYSDFVKVIDTKSTEWLKDSERCKYLRPETLFGTKFEGYLNQKATAAKPDSSNKFHNFDGKIQNYTEKELEKIARRKLGGR